MIDTPILYCIFHLLQRYKKYLIKNIGSRLMLFLNFLLIFSRISGIPLFYIVLVIAVRSRDTLHIYLYIYTSIYLYINVSIHNYIYHLSIFIYLRYQIRIEFTLLFYNYLNTWADSLSMLSTSCQAYC